MQQVLQNKLLLKGHAIAARVGVAFAGEVAIDLQRVGNHCKDIAAELHKVKTDIRDGSPASTALQLKQRNAALSDQLQQTAARWVVTSSRTNCNNA